MRGYGYQPWFVRGRRARGDAPGAGRRPGRDRRRDPPDPGRRAQRRNLERPRWPMIVLRTPKGWTGPGGRRRTSRARRATRCRSRACRRPRALRAAGGVDAQLPAGGALRRARPPAARGRRRSRPTGERRMGANPHANGGLLLHDLRLPDFRDYAVDVAAPGADAERGDARARRLAARRRARQPGHASASSVRTRPPPTGSAPSSRSPTAPGWPRSSRPTTTSRPTAG